MLGKPNGSIGKWGRVIRVNDAEPTQVLDQNGTGRLAEWRKAGTALGWLDNDGKLTVAGLAAIVASQATGDFLYASSATAMARLAVQSSSMLGVVSGLPAYRTYAQVLQDLFKDKNLALLYIPGGSWDSAVTGGVVTQKPGYVDCNSTATSGRSARASTEVLALLSAGQSHIKQNWAKAGFIAFRFALVLASGANGIARVQIGRAGAANDAVDMDARGVGIKIANTALSGLTHNGSALAAPSLSTTLVAGTTYHMLIPWDGAGNIEWFLDGVSKGTSAAGPATLSDTNDTSLQVTAENGADSATEQIRVSPFLLGVVQ